MNEQSQWEPRAIRGIRLLEGEEPSLALHSEYGLQAEPPSEGAFLLLTNRRVMRLSREGGRERFGLASLEEIDHVEISEPVRGPGALITGGLLMLAGLLAGLIVDAFGFSLLIALTAAGALVGLGVLSASKFFVADEMAAVVFHTGASEMAFPLHSRRAIRDGYALLSHFFELKARVVPRAALEGAALFPAARQSSLPHEKGQEEAVPAEQPGLDLFPESLQGSFAEIIPAETTETEERRVVDPEPPMGPGDAEATPDQEQRQEYP